MWVVRGLGGRQKTTLFMDTSKREEEEKGKKTAKGKKGKKA
jgi:hypothetical protein